MNAGQGVMAGMCGGWGGGGKLIERNHTIKGLTSYPHTASLGSGVRGAIGSEAEALKKRHETAGLETAQRLFCFSKTKR